MDLNCLIDVQQVTEIYLPIPKISYTGLVIQVVVSIVSGNVMFKIHYIFYTHF